jgi:hypothetical protein
MNQVQSEEYEWSAEEGYDEDKTYTKSQLGLLADEFLKQDSRREFCRRCEQEGGKTGVVNFVLRVNKNGEPRIDEEGQNIYNEIPEYKCENSHHWFKGKGKKRGIDGENPILFEEHLIKRKKREIYCVAGTPDPSIESGLYNKSHPKGRKVNTKEDRQKHGASYYK